MGADQLKRRKALEKENQRLRQAVFDLTLDKPILQEAAKGNFCALRVAADASITCVRPLAFPSAGPAARSVSIARLRESPREAATTRRG